MLSRRVHFAQFDPKYAAKLNWVNISHSKCITLSVYSIYSRTNRVIQYRTICGVFTAPLFPFTTTLPRMHQQTVKDKTPPLELEADDNPRTPCISRIHSADPDTVSVQIDLPANLAAVSELRFSLTPRREGDYKHFERYTPKTPTSPTPNRTRPTITPLMTVPLRLADNTARSPSSPHIPVVSRKSNHISNSYKFCNRMLGWSLHLWYC